ncbi:MAG: cytochrome c oxidase assembly factor 1 family protein, partial [Treponema sp.]|nr:cytochrome c oxidase assembly factor 1 family protein [Treponema sp.]
IKANSKIMDYLGEDFKRKGIFNGSINMTNGTGNASFSYTLTGKNGDAEVHVDATKTSNEWTFKKLTVYMVNGNNYIDLLKADSLEALDFIAL